MLLTGSMASLGSDGSELHFLTRRFFFCHILLPTTVLGVERTSAGRSCAPSAPQ